MRKYVQTTKQITTQELESVTCDLCKAVAPGGHWGNSFYSTQEVTIQYKEGTCYPEGAQGTVTYFDLCPDCFEILSDWLKSQGVKPSTYDYLN